MKMPFSEAIFTAESDVKLHKETVFSFSGKERRASGASIIHQM
jgi:hypothetical protein